MKKVLTAIFCLLAAALLTSAPASGKNPLSLKNIINVLTEPSDEPSDGSSTSNPNKGGKKTRTTDTRLRVKTGLDGLVVKVKSCYVDQNDNAIIEFSVENQTDNDDTITFKARGSEAYDDEGTCCTQKQISFSTPNGQFEEDLRIGIPSDVPVKVMMKIKDIDDVASMFKLVNINLWAQKAYKYETIQIKNLPIAREGD